MSQSVSFCLYLYLKDIFLCREGLRTLVVARKTLSEDAYADFEQRYSAAKLSVVNRSAQATRSFVIYIVTICQTFFFATLMNVILSEDPVNFST